MINIELDTTYHKDIEIVSFDNLPKGILYEMYKDGRTASKFFENVFTVWYPLEVQDVKGYDHIDEDGQKYEMKCFTRRGSKYCPSGMVGSGRHIDEEVMRENIVSNNLIYIMVDIVDFPSIRYKFINGLDLLHRWPKASIPFKDREVLFG